MGLNGNNNNCYATSLMRPAQKLGFRVCVYIFRGAAGLRLLTPKLNNGNSWQDLSVAINHIKNNYISQQKFIAYGVSLGGLIL